jgi:hypothetical protein
MGLLHLRDAFDARHKWQPRQQRQQQMCQEAYDAGQVALQAGLDTAGMHRKRLNLVSSKPELGTRCVSALYGGRISNAAPCMTTVTVPCVTQRLGEHAPSLPVCITQLMNEAQGVPHPAHRLLSSFTKRMLAALL